MQIVSKEFLEYKADIIVKLNKIHLVLSDVKEIDYGEQLIFESAKIELKITLYYNKKNKFKYIINKVTPPIFKDFIDNTLLENELLESNVTEMNSDDGIVTEETSSGLIAGSDESGKGDYFGPLVVAAFTTEKQGLDRLLKYGVKDSKLLSDERVIVLAEKIFLDFRGDYEYFILMPEKYNELYAKFSIYKPGLNEMLAWMHSKVICNLHKRKSFHKVIIDKFANERLINYYIKKAIYSEPVRSDSVQSIVPIDIPSVDSENSDFNIEICTRAESFTVVATASIIARYLYIKKIDELSEQYKIPLIKGASKKVKALKQSINPEILPFLCKMHFKD